MKKHKDGHRVSSTFSHVGIDVKRNVQNKTKDYESGEFCLTIYTYRMYKYF